MNQILLIRIDNQSINNQHKSPLYYLEYISSLYKFKIKKIIVQLNGAFISINSNNIRHLIADKFVIILNENDIYNNIHVSEFFNSSSYKLLLKYNNE